MGDLASFFAATRERSARSRDTPPFEPYSTSPDSPRPLVHLQHISREGFVRLVISTLKTAPLPIVIRRHRSSYAFAAALLFVNHAPDENFFSSLSRLLFTPKIRRLSSHRRQIRPCVYISCILASSVISAATVPSCKKCPLFRPLPWPFLLAFHYFYTLYSPSLQRFPISHCTR